MQYYITLSILSLLHLSLFAQSFSDTTIRRIIKLNKGGIDGPVGFTKVLSDGKILAGYYNEESGIDYIVRFNENGTFDDNFCPEKDYISNLTAIFLADRSKVLINNILNGINNYEYTFAIQSDDKIIVGGYYYKDYVQIYFLVRFNPDGTIDSSFNSNISLNNQVTSICIQKDNKIIIAGSFTNICNTPKKYFARLFNDGRLDTSFTVQNDFISNNYDKRISKLSIQNNNKFMFWYHEELFRYSIDGTKDVKFKNGKANGLICSYILQKDEKIIIAGEFSMYNNYQCNNIIRLNPDGTIDTTFHSITDKSINSCSLQENGKIIIGGRFEFCNGIPKRYLARLEQNGDIDSTFYNDYGADGQIYSVKFTKEKKIYIAGVFGYYNGKYANSVARINKDGTLDSSFHSSLACMGVQHCVVQNNGKIIVVTFDYLRNHDELVYRIVRLNKDGSIDSTFNHIKSYEIIKDIYIQKNEKILAHVFYNFGKNKLIRINQDGSIDTSFHLDTSIESISSYTTGNDGSIIAYIYQIKNGVGQSNFARLNSDGNIEVIFNKIEDKHDFNIFPVLQDDKVIIPFNDKLIRYNSDGTIDDTFNQVIVNNRIDAVSIIQSGEIIIGGGFSEVNGEKRTAIAKLDYNGLLNKSFNIDFCFYIISISPLEKNRLVLNGFYNRNKSNYSRAMNGLVIIDTEGKIDTTFDTGRR